MANPPIRAPYEHRTERRTSVPATRVRVTEPATGTVSVRGRLGSARHPGSPPDFMAMISPMISAATEDVGAAAAGMQGSLGKLESVMRQETNLPALPVPAESGMGADFMGRLGANLASVMTGQGGFSSDMQETIRREKERREMTIQQNSMLQREEAIRKRGELLQFEYMKYGEAAERLREANRNALSLKMQGLQGKAAAELADWTKKVDAYYEQENLNIKGQYEIAQQWIAKGFTYDLQTGQVGASGTYGSMFAKQKQLWTQADATKAILEHDTLMLDKRTKKSPEALRQATMQKLEMMAMPRQGEDFEAVIQRMTGPGGIQFGYDNKEITDDAKFMIVGVTALANMDTVPGAREYYEQVFAPEMARQRQAQEKLEKEGAGKEGASVLTPAAKEKLKGLFEALKPFMEEQFGDINPFDTKRSNAFTGGKK